MTRVDRTTTNVDGATLRSIERWLYREARLLDEERYEEWLDLLDEDVHYWVPGIEHRFRQDPAGSHGIERMAYFDDDLSDLRVRVARLCSPTAWGEDPPTRHLHLVSNIEVEPSTEPDNFEVRSVIINMRGQGRTGTDVLYARRHDRLRAQAESFLLVRRKVELRHTVLEAKNLNTLL